MPYKYIGRATPYRGKSLWEILGNLKNFGAHRLVIRNAFQRYPEPCYMEVVKCEALPNNPPRGYTEELKYGSTPHIFPRSYDKRKMIALVQSTFRGEKVEVLKQIERTSYKSDYELIPKSKEINFRQNTLKKIPNKPMADRIDLPPLIIECIKKNEYFHKMLTKDFKMDVKKDYSFKRDRSNM